MTRPVVVACVLFAVGACGQTTGPSGTTPGPRTPVTPTQEWVMPNLVGSTLQQAQDAIQKLTGNPVFITRSHDATGQKRNQVVDSNWKVCTQNIAPGAQVTAKSTIDFGAVKTDESCP